MVYNLVGKYRNTFVDDNDKTIGYGRIYVTSDFEDDRDGEFAGVEAAEIKLDYDSVGELPDKLPCRINIDFDRKGKVRQVSLLND